MLLSTLSAILNKLPIKSVHAHCDGPCGVYDPASTRVAAEAVLSMTKKLLALEAPGNTNSSAWATYNNTFSRFVAVKEEQAQEAKEQLLILWTDYFKPEHLAAYPDLHDIFWKATKLCSAVKVEVSAVHADELMDAIKEIHEIFWKSKNREVAWYTAG